VLGAHLYISNACFYISTQVIYATFSSKLFSHLSINRFASMGEVGAPWATPLYISGGFGGFDAVFERSFHLYILLN